jgi:hypothetical protein
VTSTLVDGDELDLEVKGRVLGDPGEGLGSVGKGSAGNNRRGDVQYTYLRRPSDQTREGDERDDKLPLSTDGHAGNTLVPTLDDLTLAEVEDELDREEMGQLGGLRTGVPGEERTYRLSVGVAVKDLAVGKLSDVTHTDLLARLGDGSRAKLGVLDDQTGRKGLLLKEKHGINNGPSDSACG